MNAVKKREASFKHYRPKRWHPEFDLIVLASFMGKTNTEIAKEFGYTPQHVSNILSTSQAEEIRDSLREKISNQTEISISDRLKEISNVSLTRVETFLKNDELFEKSPFAFIDRAMRAAQIAQEKNDPKFQVNINNQTNNNVLGNDAIDRIANALEVTTEVGLLHSGLDPSKRINNLEGETIKDGIKR
jgi:predicted transcriptional regulator